MAATTPGAEAAADPVVFNIRLRSGIWGVQLDGQFYGDYRSLRTAMEGVREEARTFQARGRPVRVVTLSAGGAVLTTNELGNGRG